MRMLLAALLLMALAPASAQPVPKGVNAMCFKRGLEAELIGRRLAAGEPWDEIASEPENQGLSDTNLPTKGWLVRQVRTRSHLAPADQRIAIELLCLSNRFMGALLPGERAQGPDVAAICKAKREWEAGATEILRRGGNPATMEEIRQAMRKFNEEHGRHYREVGC